jgi:hypothetical protein
MTEETADNIQSTEDVVVMKGQIAALTRLVTHLLCVSAVHMALDTGDTNFDRVPKDMEDLAFEQIKSVIIEDEDAPAVEAVAIRFQKEIFKAVWSQLKKAARILTAMNKHHLH